MSNLDNQPDPLWTEVQKGNAQAEVMRKLIQSKFPRTDRLLNGIRFQLPVRRQADYPNHEYAATANYQGHERSARTRHEMAIFV